MTPSDLPRFALTRRRYGVPRAASDDLRLVEPRRAHARRIVLTGGPGSGKSTAASVLAREFLDELWVLPEAATLLYRGGLPRGDDEQGVHVSQRAIFHTQRSLEQAGALRHPERTQLCDRGTVDGAAYWPGGSDAFFRAMGTTRTRELARYDAVIFLHSAASLPAGYERDIELRTEERDLALELDQRCFDLYSDHPKLVAIQSQGSFFAKLSAVRDAVGALLSEPDARSEPNGPAEFGDPDDATPFSTLASLADLPAELLPS